MLSSKTQNINLFRNYVYVRTLTLEYFLDCWHYPAQIDFFFLLDIYTINVIVAIYDAKLPTRNVVDEQYDFCTVEMMLRQLFATKEGVV